MAHCWRPDCTLAAGRAGRFQRRMFPEHPATPRRLVRLHRPGWARGRTCRRLRLHRFLVPPGARLQFRTPARLPGSAWVHRLHRVSERIPAVQPRYRRNLLFQAASAAPLAHLAAARAAGRGGDAWVIPGAGHAALDLGKIVLGRNVQPSLMTRKLRASPRGAKPPVRPFRSRRPLFPHGGDRSRSSVPEPRRGRQDRSNGSDTSPGQ